MNWKFLSLIELALLERHPHRVLPGRRCLNAANCPQDMRITERVRLKKESVSHRQVIYEQVGLALCTIDTHCLA